LATASMARGCGRAPRARDTGAIGPLVGLDFDDPSSTYRPWNDINPATISHCASRPGPERRCWAVLTRRQATTSPSTPGKL
jgi:hypothetical protein